MSEPAPHICEPSDSTSGRPASLIFLHGYGDDAEGIPLGIAQQFQWHSKLPYLRWILPYAPHSHEAMTRAWFLPKAIPNAMKPRIPGHIDEEETGPDDVEGIMNTINTLDQLVELELDRGVEPDRILVGGFSQGCAASLVWGLVGAKRGSAGGLVCLSGYLPLSDQIDELRKVENPRRDGARSKQWYYAHGTKDLLVPRRFFRDGQEQLKKWVVETDVESHLYENMGHSTGSAELRDLLAWMERIIPP